MNFNLKSFLTTILLSFLSLPSMAQEEQDSIWISPIKVPGEYEQNGITYHLPEGVYVQVVAIDNGNIILGDSILTTDLGAKTDRDKRIHVAKSELNRANELLNHMTVVNDSLIAFDFAYLKGEMPFKVYVKGNLVDSIQAGQNDTIALSTLGLTTKGSMFLAQDNKLATYVLIKDLPTFTTPIDVPKSKLPLPLWAIISIAAVILLLIVFIVIKLCIKKGPKKPDYIVALERLTKEIEKTDKKLNKIKESNKGEVGTLKKKADECKEKITKICDLISNNEQLQDATATFATSIQNTTEIVKNAGLDHKKVKEFKSKLDGQINNYNVYKSQLESDLRQANNVIEWTLPGKQPAEPTEELSEEQRLKNKIQSLESEKQQLSGNLKIEKNARDKAERELKAANDDLEKKKSELKKLKDEQDEIVRKKVANKEDECNRKIANERSRADKAEEKANNIRKELNDKFDIERNKAKEEKEKLNNTLAETKKTLTDTSAKLASTEESLRKSNRQVENLTAETESFHRHLSGIQDAKSYCDNILNLLDLSEKIQQAAADLIKAELDDKYYIYKALALYSSKLNALNLPNFYADVEMVSKTGFVIKGTPLASYDSSLPKAELESLVKNFFFTSYLKTYFDALVVLNESLIGLRYLMNDINPSALKAFENYRDQIENIARSLGIQVLTVKIYDSVGTNTDLLATEVDAGHEKHGAILEIENCKVQLIGGAPDNSRIIVKIQK